MTIPNQSKTPRIIDDPNIVEVYANKLIAASFDGGAITVTLGTTRLVPNPVDETISPGQPPNVCVAARMALSPAAAIELANAIHGILNVAGTIGNRGPVQPPATKIN